MKTCVKCIHRECCNMHGYVDADECGCYRKKKPGNKMERRKEKEYNEKLKREGMAEFCKYLLDGKRVGNDPVVITVKEAMNHFGI